MKFSDFFKDIDESASMKRLIGFVLSLGLIVTIAINLITGKAPDKEIVYSIEYIIIACVVGISSEKFTKRGITSVALNDSIKKEEKDAEIQQEEECADCKKEK